MRQSCLKAAGTPAFYAPEMCVGRPYHGQAADVWAAGVSLCLMASGELPFDADNLPDVFEKIKEQPPAIPPRLSPALRDLLSQLLRKPPEQRPGLPALREHAWLTNHGREPLPPGSGVVVSVTEDDVRGAVRQLHNTMSIINKTAKWRLRALGSRAGGLAEPLLKEEEQPKPPPQPAARPRPMLRRSGS